MPFYQNLFNDAHITWTHNGTHSPNWFFPGNVNSVVLMHAFNYAPYNFTGKTTLTFNVCLGPNYTTGRYENFSSFTVDVTSGAVSLAAETAFEVVSALNANTTFNKIFEADVITSGSLNVVQIRANSSHRNKNIRAYISNSSAESILGFNKRAGVVDAPSYFSRHTIANISNYTDSLGTLIELNTGDADDLVVIANAGLDASNPESFGSIVIYDDITMVADAAPVTSDVFNTVYSGPNPNVFLIKIINGETGPTVGASIQLEGSADGVNFYPTESLLTASTANDTTTVWTKVIPSWAKYSRITSGYNTGEDVTLRVELILV